MDQGRAGDTGVERPGCAYGSPSTRIPPLLVFRHRLPSALALGTCFEKRREKKLGKSFRIQDVFVLHLVGGKPWEPGDPGAGEYPLSHGAWHAIRRECGLPDDGY